MFAIRAVLASTMGTSWGVYSGYELFEHLPVREGSEEYLDSEKYELRPRDFEAALEQGQSLEPFLKRLNEIRHVHPALCQMRTITIHHVDNDALLAYSKFDPMTGDCVLVMVTLNAFGPEETRVAGRDRTGCAALRPILGARRDHRRGISVGPIELHPHRPRQGGRTHPQHAVDSRAGPRVTAGPRAKGAHR